MKNINIFLKKKKEKNRQYGRKRYKNLPENENRKWLTIEKILQSDKKRIDIISICFSVIIKNYSPLKNLLFFWTRVGFFVGVTPYK